MDDNVLWLDMRGESFVQQKLQTWDSVSKFVVLGAKILENQHVLPQKNFQSDFSLI